MPSSWSESNRLHSSNQRNEAAVDAVDDFFNEEFNEEVEYRDSFDTYAEDAYLDSYYESLTDLGDF